MGCHCSVFDNDEEIRTNIVEPLLNVVKSQFEEYTVLVYSKSNCEDSLRVKQIFRQNSISFEYFEVDNMSEGADLLQVLQKLTNQKSPPYVFIKGRFYGGLKSVTNGFRTGDLPKSLIRS